MCIPAGSWIFRKVCEFEPHFTIVASYFMKNRFGLRKKSWKCQRIVQSTRQRKLPPKQEFFSLVRQYFTNSPWATCHKFPLEDIDLQKFKRLKLHNCDHRIVDRSIVYAISLHNSLQVYPGRAANQRMRHLTHWKLRSRTCNVLEFHWTYWIKKDATSSGHG